MGNTGGNGFIMVFEGKEPGKNLMFRCEMDALPVQETGNTGYRSERAGISHACGHDGHMAIMAGFAEYLANHPPRKGKTFLLFQPAEETGEGAARVMEDKNFTACDPACVFALHNLPGFPIHRIIIRHNTFACASKGMLIKLKGRTAHAGEPEKGINPALAVSRIVMDLLKLSGHQDLFSSFTLITIVHIRLGEIAFGTSAGYAELRATLRAYKNSDMEKLSHRAGRLVIRHARRENLEPETSFTEPFPALENHPEAMNILENALKKKNIQYTRAKKVFRWSEDFSRYGSRYKTAFFGIGAGETHAGLHSPGYDFPDELIGTGIQAFAAIQEYMNTL